MNKENFIKDEDDIVYRMDGRVEWVCEDGIGHTIYSLDNNFVHGCNGNCSKLKFPKE